MIAIGEQAQHDACLSRPVTTFNSGLCQATIAAERASLGSVLSILPLSRSRTRDDNFGGTSTTCSPAATSCWASNAPIPVAPLMAQVRGENGAAHAEQPGPLMPISVDTDRVDHRLCPVDRSSGVGTLVGVDADHEHDVFPRLVVGFATVGTPDMWLMPFLLRATPRLDLADWSVRSEANLTATGHSRDTPGQTHDATNQRNVLHSILHQATCAMWDVAQPVESRPVVPARADGPPYGRREASTPEVGTCAMWSGYLVAFAGLAVVMVRVPGGLSVAERIGWWFFICGTLSVGVLNTLSSTERKRDTGRLSVRVQLNQFGSRRDSARVADVSAAGSDPRNASTQAFHRSSAIPQNDDNA